MYQLLRTYSTAILLREKRIQVFSSGFLSFLWVLNYQYKYNVAVFNTPLINIWAFSLWILTGFLFLEIYSFIRKKVGMLYLQFIFSWLVYFTGLLVFEYAGYYILDIRECSARGGALIFGLIHGSKLMHTYYMLFPALIIAIYHLFLVLPVRIQKYVSVIKSGFIERRYKTWP